MIDDLDGHAPLDGHEPLDGHKPGPVAGIDIGGTKIATLIVDADGAVLGRATHASSVGDQGGAVPSIAACLDEALAAAGLARRTSPRSASVSPVASTRRGAT